MRRLRFTAKALLPVLILTAIFFGSCEKDGGSEVDPGPPNIDPEVDSFDYTISSTIIDDYFGKVDTLNIDVKAKNADGLGVEDATVVLTVTEGPGSILFPTGNKTSVEGIVNAKYVLAVSQIDTAIIEAKVGNVTAQTKTVYISSEDVHISINATPLESEVDQGATATSDLRIRVRDSQGVNVSGVPIKVQLLSTEGTLTLPIVDPATDAFTSTLTVDEVNETTECQIRAYVDVEIEEATEESVQGSGKKSKNSRSITASTMTDTVLVRFIPLSSQVDHITVSIDPDQIIAGAGVSETATVTAVAANEDNNGIPNLQLYFRLRNLDETLPAGTVSVPALTDETGNTTATISTDGAFGVWALEVRTSQANQTFWADTLTVLTGDPQNITVVSDTNRISIYGTNGIETTTIRAQVKDQNNQPVQDGKMVYFLAENYPRTNNVDDLRLRINDSNGEGSPYQDLQYINLPGLPFDSAATNAGEAFVSLTAGETKGPIRLRVWTYEDDAQTQEIASSYDGLMIVSGPPHNIEVDYNPTGEQQGSSIYNLEISARVQDEQNNDVEDGYSVSFWVDPEDAHVWDIGLTGNPGPISDAVTPGVAYAALSYHSIMTNEEVTISAAINRITGERETSQVTMVLPIQNAMGTMFASPLNWDYGENNDDPAIVELRLEIRDGYGHLIDGQTVLFGCTKGRIITIDQDIPGMDPVYYAVTGPRNYQTEDLDDDPTGVAVRYWVAQISEAFPDPATPETNIQIMAEIVGTPDASVEPITIYLIQ